MARSSFKNQSPAQLKIPTVTSTKSKDSDSHPSHGNSSTVLAVQKSTGRPSSSSNTNGSKKAQKSTETVPSDPHFMELITILKHLSGKTHLNLKKTIQALRNDLINEFGSLALDSPVDMELKFKPIIKVNSSSSSSDSSSSDSDDSDSSSETSSSDESSDDDDIEITHVSQTGKPRIIIQSDDSSESKDSDSSSEATSSDEESSDDEDVEMTNVSKTGKSDTSDSSDDDSSDKSSDQSSSSSSNASIKKGNQGRIKSNQVNSKRKLVDTNESNGNKKQRTDKSHKMSPHDDSGDSSSEVSSDELSSDTSEQDSDESISDTDVSDTDVSSSSVSSGSSSSSSSSSSEDSSSSEEDSTAFREAKLNREREKNVAAAAAAAMWTPKTPDNQKSIEIVTAKGSDGAQALSGGKPFKRVDDEHWGAEAQQLGGALADNSYEGVFGEAGFGAKASSKLLQVRGKRFQHEKTKAKRSYNGFAKTGQGISMESFSTKFDD